MTTISYFSAGVSSAVATKLMIDEIDRIIYIHIEDQHPDTLRFVKDCEAWFGKPVEIMQSQILTVENAILYASFIRNPETHAVACSRLLKKSVRKELEQNNMERIRAVWGFDVKEKDRADAIVEKNQNSDHVFPLIERGIGKSVAHKILYASGIKRPLMYKLGYPNNNCIGCVRGGMGYWNKIRVDFPEVFASRAKLERKIGFSILGKGLWLDELDPNRGKKERPICDDCSLFCGEMKL